MDTSRHFRVAPWPASLKVSSVLGTILLVAVGIVSYRAIPVAGGIMQDFGLALTLFFVVVLVGSFFSTVTGYKVSSTDLAIQRLLWTSHVSLVGLRSVFADPSACKGSTRILGNAGLFGYTGRYRSDQLGQFRLFATDLTRSVVLVLPVRSVVITPAVAEAFIAHIHHVFPATNDGASAVPNSV